MSMQYNGWATQKSQERLRRELDREQQKRMPDFEGTHHDILSRRLKFIPASKRINQAQSYDTSHNSSSSSTPPRNGRQRSEFNPPSRHLFSENTIQELMSWPSVARIGAGLSNLGNTCFMNATLQCLCYTSPLQNVLKKQFHSRSCRVSAFCAFCELERLLPGMLSTEIGSLRPQTLFHHLRKVASQLRPGRQEDAHEFLRGVLDSLHESSLHSIRPKVKDVRVQETTVVHKVWGGYLRSQIKCKKCHHESNTYEAFLDLSLEIRGNGILSALRHFMASESLDGDNKYRCSNCKKLRPATKQFTVFEPPNVLVLHLKRFEYTSSRFGGKINKQVEFGSILDVTNLMSYSTCPKVTYALFGVLVHSGGSAHSGHYYSFVRAPNDQWYLMDDSSVRSVSLKTVLGQKAYILFYKRREPKVLYRSPSVTPRKRESDLLSLTDALPRMLSLESGLENDAVLENPPSSRFAALQSKFSSQVGGRNSSSSSGVCGIESRSLSHPVSRMQSESSSPEKKVSSHAPSSSSVRSSRTRKLPNGINDKTPSLSSSSIAKFATGGSSTPSLPRLSRGGSRLKKPTRSSLHVMQSSSDSSLDTTRRRSSKHSSSSLTLSGGRVVQPRISTKNRSTVAAKRAASASEFTEESPRKKQRLSSDPPEQRSVGDAPIETSKSPAAAHQRFLRLLKKKQQRIQQGRTKSSAQRVRHTPLFGRAGRMYVGTPMGPFRSPPRPNRTPMDVDDTDDPTSEDVDMTPPDLVTASDSSSQSQSESSHSTSMPQRAAVSAISTRNTGQTEDVAKYFASLNNRQDALGIGESTWNQSNDQRTSEDVQHLDELQPTIVYEKDEWDMQLDASNSSKPRQRDRVRARWSRVESQLGGSKSNSLSNPFQNRQRHNM